MPGDGLDRDHRLVARHVRERITGDDVANGVHVRRPGSQVIVDDDVAPVHLDALDLLQADALGQRTPPDGHQDELALRIRALVSFTGGDGEGQAGLRTLDRL